MALCDGDEFELSAFGIDDFLRDGADGEFGLGLGAPLFAERGEEDDEDDEDDEDGGEDQDDDESAFALVELGGTAQQQSGLSERSSRRRKTDRKQGLQDQWDTVVCSIISIYIHNCVPFAVPSTSNPRDPL